MVSKSSLHAMVRTWGQACAAAEAAAAIESSLVLWTPEGAAGWLGPNWVASLRRGLKQQYRSLEISIVLDCGGRTGDALAALRMGICDLRYLGSPETATKLEAMGARFWLKGPLLDLTEAKHPAISCRNYLAPSHPAR